MCEGRGRRTSPGTSRHFPRTCRIQGHVPRLLPYTGNTHASLYPRNYGKHRVIYKHHRSVGAHVLRRAQPVRTQSGLRERSLCTGLSRVDVPGSTPAGPRRLGGTGLPLGAPAAPPCPPAVDHAGGTVAPACPGARAVAVRTRSHLQRMDSNVAALHLTLTLSSQQKQRTVMAAPRPPPPRGQQRPWAGGWWGVVVGAPSPQRSGVPRQHALLVHALFYVTSALG